jgi:hypothetical protein
MSRDRLRQLIDKNFSLEELRTLCFDLGVDYDSLSAEGKTGKVRELISYIVRRDRLPELIEHLANSRPAVPWSELSLDDIYLSQSIVEIPLSPAQEIGSPSPSAQTISHRPNTTSSSLWKTEGGHVRIIILGVLVGLVTVFLILTRVQTIAAFLSHVANLEIRQIQTLVISTVTLALVVATIVFSGRILFRSRKISPQSILNIVFAYVVWFSFATWVLSTPPEALLVKNPAPLTDPLTESFTWNSDVYVQNMGTRNANVEISLSQSGSTTAINPVEIPLGHSHLVLSQYGPVLFDSGSTTVVSDQPITAVVVLNGIGEHDNKSRLRLLYTGIFSNDQTLYYPIIKNNYKGVYTELTIQNIDTHPNTFTVTFTMSDGAEYIYRSPVIPPGDSIIVTPGDAGVQNGSNDARRSLGSAVVSSNSMLSGTWSEKTTENNSNINTLPALTASSSTNKAYVAGRSTNYEYLNLYIVNIEKNPIDVDVQYGLSSVNGSACADLGGTGHLDNILPQSSRIYALRLPANPSEPCYKWAIIEGSGKFVVFTSESASFAEEGADAIYQVHPFDTLTNNIALPLYLEQFAGLSSSFHLRNPGLSTAANVIATFYCEDNNGQSYTATTKPLRIPPTSAIVFYQLSKASNLFTQEGAIRPNSRCSVIAQGDEPFFGFAVEQADDPNITTWVNYNATNFSR